MGAPTFDVTITEDPDEMGKKLANAMNAKLAEWEAKVMKSMEAKYAELRTAQNSQQPNKPQAAAQGRT